MNYCENCNACFEYDYCPLCGTKKIRHAHDGDFCLLLENNASCCEWLACELESYGIQSVTMPYGSGYESRLGLKLTIHRLYVPYEHYEKAREILHDIEKEETETLRAPLLEKLSLLHAPEKLEKKTRKKLKLPPDTQFIEFCAEIVKNAEKIVDGGSIPICPKYGHYMYCYRDDLYVLVNSETMEILSVTRLK